MVDRRENIKIDYLSRDFSAIKEDLIQHAKRYYPDTFKDFSNAGFGALMVDAVSYIGDILSFYLDYQANESFILTANEYGNLLKHAQTVGYRHPGPRSTFGEITLYVLLPPNTTNTGPDLSYAPMLKAGSAFTAGLGSGSRFTLLSDVDFSNSDNEVVVATTNPISGVPTEYAVKASGRIVSGELRTQEFVVGNFIRFRDLLLDSPAVTEVISVVDTEGREYYEVDHLSQNTIYIPIANNDTTTSVQAPTIMKPFIVPRRFIVRRTGPFVDPQTRLIFGYGSDSQLNSPSLVDTRDVVLDLHSKTYVTDKAMDPTILIKGDKFGVGPVNTTLRVTYRTNTAASSQAGAGAINSVAAPILEFKNRTTLSVSKVSAVRNSLEVFNEKAIQGDVRPPTATELRQLLMGTQAAQNRAVTAEDYKTLILSMPAKFGGVHRCSVIQDVDSNLRNINIYVINVSNNGHLETTNLTLKENIKTWLNTKRMINDSVDILDAKIINLSIQFSALAEADENKSLIFNRIKKNLASYVSVKQDVGESFSITDLYTVINRTRGVVDATFVKVVQKRGVGYATTSFSVKNYTTPDGRSVRAPKNVIFEVKYPDVDIEGTVK